jgi:hypothetical protein
MFVKMMVFNYNFYFKHPEILPKSLDQHNLNDENEGVKIKINLNIHLDDLPQDRNNHESKGIYIYIFLTMV